MSWWNSFKDAFKSNAKEAVKKTAKDAVEEAYSISIKDLAIYKFQIEGFLDVLRDNEVDEDTIIEVLLLLSRRTQLKPISSAVKAILSTAIVSLEQVKESKQAR